MIQFYTQYYTTEGTQTEKSDREEVRIRKNLSESRSTKTSRLTPKDSEGSFHRDGFTATILPEVEQLLRQFGGNFLQSIQIGSIGGCYTIM